MTLEKTVKLFREKWKKKKDLAENDVAEGRRADAAVNDMENDTSFENALG